MTRLFSIRARSIYGVIIFHGNYDLGGDELLGQLCTLVQLKDTIS